jgi:hypothetical protein
MERESDEALKRAVGEVPPESARSDAHDDRREDESSSLKTPMVPQPRRRTKATAEPR